MKSLVEMPLPDPGSRAGDRLMAACLSSNVPVDQFIFEASRLAFRAEFSRSDRRTILKCIRTSKPIPKGLHERFMQMLGEQVELDA